MKTATTFLVYSILVAGCAEESAAPIVVLSQAQGTFSGAPMYAVASSEAWDDVLLAEGSGVEPYCVTVTNKTTDSGATLDFTVAPQAVAVGVDAQGRRFVLAATLDYGANTSALWSIIDTNADGLPDEVTELFNESPAHWISMSRHADSKAVYIADALNDRVLRYQPDATGLPDEQSRVVYLQSGALAGDPLRVRRVDEAAENSARVWQEQYQVDEVGGGTLSFRLDDRLFRASGVNGGPATSIDDLRYWRRPEGRFRDAARASFTGYVRHGSSSIAVKGNPLDVNMEIHVVNESGVSTETLASFTSTGLTQTVALSRTVSDGERLQIRKVGEDNSLGGTFVIASTTLRIDYSDVGGKIAKLPQLGGTLTFHGTVITGSETVDVMLTGSEGESWTSCSVQETTTTTITITIPVLAASGGTANLVFRITAQNGDTLYRQVLAKTGN